MHTRSPFGLIIVPCLNSTSCLAAANYNEISGPSVCVAGGEGDRSNHRGPGDEERHAPCLH